MEGGAWSKGGDGDREGGLGVKVEMGTGLGLLSSRYSET